MSMTGSLMPFDNNNDVAAKSGGKSKNKPQVTPKQPVSGACPSGSTTSLGAGSASSGGRRRRTCFRAHLNSLWSVWYGLCTTGLQAYVATLGAERFLGIASKLPRLEAHAYLALTGAAVLLLPFFLTSAVFKIGNLANDGFKLGRHLSTCSADPPGVLLGAGNGVLRSLWQHGGPTAPFLHLATAFCLLLPKLLVEARLIQSGYLPHDDIWRTDLDFLMVHSDRLVVLSFVTNGSSLLPTPLPSSAVSTPSNQGLHTSNTTNVSSTSSGGNSLALLGDPDAADLRSADWGPVSAEFLNYALALLVYAVRYPAVFWHTNKAFGTLFSFQLLVNGLQSLVAYSGLCVLYKVQVLGAKEALPMLHLRMSHSADDGSPFLLNTHVTLALFVLSNVLVLASSLVLYLYGYGRFIPDNEVKEGVQTLIQEQPKIFFSPGMKKLVEQYQKYIDLQGDYVEKFSAFLDHERFRRSIMLRSSGGWGYFTHCAALCVLLSLCVCRAPLLYDLTVVYRGSLDPAVLACVIGCILHLLLWVLLWLILTLKQRWSFKLRVTVGHAKVRSARSVRLVTDVELAAEKGSHEGTAPLLVVGNGRTYTVADTSPKKAIMSVLQKAALERKAKAGQGGSGGEATDEGEEQIYWLRPKPPSPKTSPDSGSERLTWLNRKLSGTNTTRHKVTFDESLNSASSRKGKSLLAKSPKSCSKGKGKGQPRSGLDQLSESEDDGDYATLRELPLASLSEDTASEDNKLLECDTNKPLIAGDYEDPSPLLTPETTEDDPPSVPAPVNVTVHSTATADSHQLQGSVTPRCLRRADSGMPQEELTPRSDSVSTESSASGSSPPCGNHSETSSGVHSNSSSEAQKDQSGGPRRSTSVDDLATVLEQPRVQAPWRSFSLQRNVLPPTAATCPPNGCVVNNPNSGLTPIKTVYASHNGCVVSLQNGGISASPSVKTVYTTSKGCIVSLTNGNSGIAPTGQPIYGFGNVQYSPHIPSSSNVPTTVNATNDAAQLGGCPAVLLENTADTTVVIRRKQSRPKTSDGNQPPVLKEEPFGRSTNMRMTSFTDNPDGSRLGSGECFPSSSSTLPHYPTQPVAIAAVYPHCSTMPLPSSTGAGSVSGMSHPGVSTGGSGSCHSFPRQHTTIPTHHNGVRLFGGPNPFVKRFPPYHHGRPPVGSFGADVVHNGSLIGHHTFPHIAQNIKQQVHKQERDSANFSMASSGDSDQYLPHT